MSEQFKKQLILPRSYLCRLRPLIMTLFIMVTCLQFIFTAIGVTSASEIHQSINYDYDNFKNQDAIGNNFIPDITPIIQNQDDKFENLRQFLKIWPNLEAMGYVVNKNLQFTIIVPKANLSSFDNTRLQDIVLEHLIPGKAFDTFNEEEIYANSKRHPIIFRTVKKSNESQWTLNNLRILRTIQFNEKISTIFINGILGDKKAAFSKRNIQKANRYNEPQNLEIKNSTKIDNIQTKDIKSNLLMTFLASMKSGTKVFQQFLSKSNLTSTMENSTYIVLIPSDNAFQRWHPIDWGFYPFSVQDFTENILRNHFIKTKIPINLNDLKSNEKMRLRTLGDEIVIFQNDPTPSVNNVSIAADYLLSNRYQIYIISEVLFVSEAVVSKLHQMHKDKETPPLLAFPWFGAQFLSHSFLALEKDPNFTQISRYLSNAEIAPFISGSNYTFFVPLDDAFKKFDMLSDNFMASKKGIKMLLNHFVRGRLYKRDLKDNITMETIGGGKITFQRKSPDNIIWVNNAKINKSEIFVYNLGTMFYISDILFPEILNDYDINGITSNIDIPTTIVTSESTIPINFKTSTKFLSTLSGDVESVPNEFIEHSGADDLVLLDDDEIITPRALPVHYVIKPPKK